MAILILPEVADEIPTAAHTPEHRAALQADVEECCSGSTSWVALDGAGSVVGFLIGKPTRINSITRQTLQGIELRYAGVRNKHRRRGHFGSMLACAKALKIPLYAVVKLKNKNKATQRLAEEGFVPWDPIYQMHDESAWAWQPPSSS